ncbi:MinD-like ATPase involved in chromosome partitioning or flagellar assembly [Nocardiopsis sp. Huas11]|uniref:ATPase n=1 Tax=Nocardiopsis sp. Huas11 TaxID=2183912 RepID=UPI000EB3A518|nr:ATPase [Nocardiopsis sp. Huas11]RKS06923.1 MinD-like ATPase involved in chromosome partitioning or flagellar assembly [Nocardiopsis sp. Huas11]
MSATQTATPRPVPGDRWPRRVGRAVLRPFRPVGEVADTIEVGARLQRSTATGRRIVVDDLGTGADTAVVTALLGRVFAHYRHDRVLAVDATAGLPSLGTRLDTVHEGGLDGGVDTTSFESARSSLGEVGERLWTVPADAADPSAYVSGLLPLSRFFGVTLVAGSSGGFVDAVGAGAHARVRVVRATRDAAVLLGRGLDRLVQEGREDELGRTVVVVFDHQGREDPGFDAVRTARVVGESGADVVIWPHDRHLAQGLAVSPRRISEATHRTVLHVAAEALNRAVDGGRPTVRQGSAP